MVGWKFTWSIIASGGRCAYVAPRYSPVTTQSIVSISTVFRNSRLHFLLKSRLLLRFEATSSPAFFSFLTYCFHFHYGIEGKIFDLLNFRIKTLKYLESIIFLMVPFLPLRRWRVPLPPPQGDLSSDRLWRPGRKPNTVRKT